MAVTTSSQFTMFCNECGRWIREFGLTGWCVSYGLGSRRKLGENVAVCYAHAQSRDAMLCLANFIGDDTSNGMDEDIRNHSLHEVLELMFARMDILMRSNDVKDYEVDEARHEVIHMLMNYIKRVEQRMEGSNEITS